MEESMNILAIGDVVGSAGCEFLRSHLSSIKKLYQADFVIVNGENSAEGNGITPLSAEHIFTSGADVITSGNHIFRRKEIFPLLDENPLIVRPANYPPSAPGKGYCIVDTGRVSVCVINLMGTVFLESLESPFSVADRILAETDPNMIKIVDIHAEATSEKKALAYYLDGRVSAVFGTHTHVQTSDEQILPKGTGFISDVGMTGPSNSVLGVDPKLVIKRFVTKMPVRFQNAEGPCHLSGVILGIDNKTFQTISINRILISWQKYPKQLEKYAFWL